MRKTILPSNLWAAVPVHLFIVSLFLGAISFTTNAQCIATSTKNGTTAVNDASIGSLAFHDEPESLAADDDRAYATALVALFNGSTNYLKVTGFGFNIPSYASICGVVVEIEKRAGGLAVGAWIRDNDIRIVKAGAVAGNDGGDDVTDWSGSESTFTYGGSSDLWGTTLTPAEVNSTNFGVAISARMRGLAIVFPSAQIDNIRVTVYYNPILPVKLLRFNAALKNNTTTLDWETADEEEGETITVQRSFNGQSSWIDLSRYDLHNSQSIKKYSYADVLAKSGNYSYRLKITNRDGQQTFSEIKNISFKDDGFLLAYPNPARDFIILENITAINPIIVTNISQQHLKVPVEWTGEHTARVNTSLLSTGIYFISTGNYKTKFFKE